MAVPGFIPRGPLYNRDMGETLKDPIGVPISLEVYLLSSGYEPDAEYVDGEIEECPMGEFDHNAWQQAIQLCVRYE